MKTKYFPLLILIPMILATGCEFFVEDTARTPDDRMEAFIEDANDENWDAMWRHVHEDSADYSSALYTSNNVIRDIFEDHIPLSGLQVSTQTATCRNKDGRTEFRFVLVEYEPENFKIRYIDKIETVFRNEQ